MENIIIRDAHENNLKHIDLEIPLNAFTCVTGCSGCGKSSLVFDTIYAESQRGFFEGITGNIYGQKIMNKPKVGSIEKYHIISDHYLLYSIVIKIVKFLKVLFLQIIQSHFAHIVLDLEQKQLFQSNC